MSDQARLDATVRGRVQGVGFRIFAADAARELQLVGWVANEAGGTVRCVAEGPRADVDRLLEALRAGPRGAFVERVDVELGAPLGGFTRFEIRSGSHSGD